jgi:hypothetical protein
MRTRILVAALVVLSVPMIVVADGMTLTMPLAAITVPETWGALESLGFIALAMVVFRVLVRRRV